VIRKKQAVSLLVALTLLVAGGTLAAQHAPPGGGDSPDQGGHAGMMGMREMHRNMMQRMMGRALPSAIDPAVLPDLDSPGAQALQQVCTQCHNLPDPRLHTAAEWPIVVDRMARRMQMMHGRMGVIAPMGEELDIVLAYLQEHAYQPINPAKYPDLKSKPGQTFLGTCSQCHAPPDPQQHRAAEWPAVVARMRGNMAAFGKAVPDETATKEIVDFLRRHGGNRK
jgi:hypothetical protein